MMVNEGSSLANSSAFFMVLSSECPSTNITSKLLKDWLARS